MRIAVLMGTSGTEVLFPSPTSRYWIVEPDRDRPELTVFELRSGAYEQVGHVAGGEEYRAVTPFPVAIVPSKLITVG